MTLSSDPTLELLYERYMDCLEAQVEASSVARATEEALHALPEYQEHERALLAARAAHQAADEALAAVKQAVMTAWRETGDRQPHPYAGVLRIDRRPVYDEKLALRWLRERSDYRHLIVPETVDRKGFEKLARALDSAGAPPLLDNGEGPAMPVVTWDNVPVISVRVREDD